MTESWRHGVYGYNHKGCRCHICSTAKRYINATADTARKAIFAATGLLPEGVVHGTTNAYRHYGCRCPDCRGANTEERRRQRAA